MVGELPYHQSTKGCRTDGYSSQWEEDSKCNAHDIAMRCYCLFAVGVDVGPCRVNRPRPSHLYGGLKSDLGIGRLGPRWESFFIGEMPSRRVRKVAESFMLIDTEGQSRP